jgi:CxxC-x17-CxxC domain-containing protein
MAKSVKPDVAELINKMQEQLAIIDRKIDTLISKSSQRLVDTRQFETKPFQPAPPAAQPVPNQENGFNRRILYKAICADCKKACEVPFKPSGERPVYCKDCFSKRKARSPFGARSDNRPRPAPAASAHASHAVRTEPVVQEKKKPVAKKKAAPKKKKK